MKPIIHTYKSKEPMLQVNAFVVETEKGLVVVDTTLTMSDSKALRGLTESLNKPIEGILLTHGHPDHIAGTSNIAQNANIPIYALESVNKLMEETEASKHAQWSGIFGEEWIPKWVYPNEIVKHGEEIKLAGLDFKVLDIGSGGDCDANSFWLMEGDINAAFVGDFIYRNNHTYMADGSILRWMANLTKYKQLLKDYSNYYIGHGDACEFADIEKQEKYFMFYIAEALEATKGSAVFDDNSKAIFEKKIIEAYPEYGCQFMIGLSAEKVAQELKSTM